MMIEEDIALLEHHLTSNKTRSSSNLIHLMIDDIDSTLKNSNEIIKTSPTTCSSSIEINRLQILKRDIIHQAIITSRRMAENLNTMIQIEQDKFSSTNRFMESTSEWQQMVFDTIETRRLNMIKRANCVIKHKLATSFDINNNLQNKQFIPHDFQKDECESYFINFSISNAD